VAADSVAVEGGRTQHANPVAAGFDGKVLDERFTGERGQFESQTTHHAVPDLGGKGHSISR
jgi:hypothetical protein